MAAVERMQHLLYWILWAQRNNRIGGGMMASGDSDHRVRSWTKDGGGAMVLPYVRRRFCFGVLWLFVTAIALLLIPLAAFAATYYVDYSSGVDTNNGTTKSTPWKHHPYMQTFTGSYTHAAGDIFIFKGGVTWQWTTGDRMFPLYVKAGGASGNSDQYTVDTTWYTGSSWSLPIFDGGQQCGGSTTTLGINATLINDYIWTPSYVVINGLQLQNVGNPSDGSGTAIQFVGGGSSIEIKNCVLNPHGLQAFAYATNTGGTSQHYWVHNNQITNTGRAVIYSYQGTTLNDVQVYSNNWQGPGSTFGSFHLDGLMVGCPTTCTSTVMTNILFYDNYFYGAWDIATAQYFSAGWTTNTIMYNNVFSLENAFSTCTLGTCLSPGFVVFGLDDSNFYIYNNTFSSDISPGAGVGVNIADLNFDTSSGTIVVEGNIFSGAGTDVAINPVGPSPITIDYNLHNPSRTGGSGYWVLNGWIGTGNFTCNSVSTCSAHGVEAHGVGSSTYSSSYPGFVAIPNGTTGSGNFRLQSSSPAVNAFPTAAAPTSIFTTDILGVSRPQGSAWNMGAYERTNIAPPGNLQVIP
jgi:hypothetical protein